jgi:hypothetical protein
LVVKQIQFVTVPLQGFWYALIFALPVLEIQRRKTLQEKALHEKIRTASDMGVAMTIAGSSHQNHQKRVSSLSKSSSSSSSSSYSSSPPPLAELEIKPPSCEDPEDPDWSEIQLGGDQGDVTKKHSQNITRI